MLSKAHGLFHAAAEAGTETITADFASRFFSGDVRATVDYGHDEPAAVAQPESSCDRSGRVNRR